MVYFENFEEFQAASREVYAREPWKTRCTCKYSNHSDGHPEVVLKVTDNVSCLKFRTRQQSDLNYIDQFAQLITLWMTLHDPINPNHPSVLPLELISKTQATRPDAENVGGKQAGKASGNTTGRKKKRKA